MVEDFERCYRAVQSKDARFDGWFFTAVTSTHIYCRPSCPVRAPMAKNVRFYPTAAAAQSAGFRACLRCRPDASPGSPEWNTRADLVGRAMRLIADGVVDREGVGGLARRLAYSERHLHRQLVAEVGAGPIALARAQRANAARLLIETTDLPLSQVAFAAGFASIRQFNDTIREIFAKSPTELRRSRRTLAHPAPGSLSLRLAHREPMRAHDIVRFLGLRAVPGIEAVTADGTYRRTLRLARGGAVVEATPMPGHVAVVLRLDDLRDLASAVERTRRLFDLDADPVAIVDQLGSDPVVGPLVAAAPGRRVPGTVDGVELAMRAILGQQVSVVGARTLAGRLVEQFGEPLPEPDEALTHRFPGPEVLAEADFSQIGMPGSRQRALRAMASALAEGEIVLDPGADREETRARLLALPGVGPWTADYLAMRALADPDAFLATDLGVRQAVRALGHPDRPAAVTALAEAWRPWRAYALQYLWSSLTDAAQAPAGAARTIPSESRRGIAALGDASKQEKET